ncbi:MAG: hypothetical protein LWW86_07850 [Micrococcales bacterium]|nr:hypothetical protein [Micrococcales bacterium]
MSGAVLRLADPESLRDLGRYAARARTLDGDGAVRLQCHGVVLAAYVCALPGRGLLGDGTVLGLRVARLAEPAATDVTVPLAAVTDRTARATDDATLPIPPVTLAPPWAALAPPRAGWEPVGAIAGDALTTAARDGIGEIAEGTPDGAGAHAVTALREKVWGRRLPAGEADIAAGGALAAYALGFLAPGREVTMLRQGRWTRLDCPGGHVLMR